MRYNELLAEGIGDWLGSKWSELTDPALRDADAQRRAIEKDVAHNYQVLAQVALRQTDQSGQQITQRTFHKMPLNTIEEYLTGNMSLDDDDMRWILDHMGLKKLTLEMLDSSRPLDSLFKTQGRVFDASAARQFMQGLARLATVRFYRKQRMQGVPKRQAQAPMTSVPASSPKVVHAWNPGDPITVIGKTYKPGDKEYNQLLAIIGTPNPRT